MTEQPTVPRGFGGCRCACHSGLSVKHMAPCCWPDPAPVEQPLASDNAREALAEVNKALIGLAECARQDGYSSNDAVRTQADLYAGYARRIRDALDKLPAGFTLPREGTERFAVLNGWLVEFADTCTCHGGGPYGHVSGCGYEPIARVEELLATHASDVDQAASINMSGD